MSSTWLLGRPGSGARWQETKSSGPEGIRTSVKVRVWQAHPKAAYVHPKGKCPQCFAGARRRACRVACTAEGDSRHTGHLMQAGCAPVSVNLLSGSACFHGDLTSEIFHLGCQMPVDEAKPPRVTKYRHSPTGSGARASSGFRVGVWTPLPRGCHSGPLRDLLFLQAGAQQGSHGCILAPHPTRYVAGQAPVMLGSQCLRSESVLQRGWHGCLRPGRCPALGSLWLPGLTAICTIYLIPPP